MGQFRLDLWGQHPVDLERQHRRKQMGRPVNKRYFGTNAAGADADGFENFGVSVRVTGQSESDSGIILSQRSTNKFKVDDAANGGGNEGICTLVDKAPGTLGEAEMILEGFVGGGSVATRIKKIYNRTCRDFDNNRYTWSISDDSTRNIMVLTAL